MGEKRHQVTISRRQKKNGHRGYDLAKEEDYNLKGTKSGHLTVLGIVPADIEIPRKRRSERYWYCQCDCGSPVIMVPTSYLGGKAGRGDYRQTSCGCMRDIRHFIACAKWDVSEDWLLQFRKDWKRFSFLYHSLLGAGAFKGDFSVSQREEIVDYFYYQKQFNSVYDFWLQQEKRTPTYYDYAKPSIDHIIPKSKGGGNNKENLRFITVFENLAKRDMTLSEWEEFKKESATSSELFIENILNRGDTNYD